MRFVKLKIMVALKHIKPKNPSYFKSNKHSTVYNK